MTKILFLGSHRRSAECLLYLVENVPTAEVIGIVLNSYDGGDYDHEPIKAIAYKHDIPILALESVRAKQYDIGLCVMFDQKLASAIVDQPPRGFVNLHLGPLPRLRGVHSAHHAIRLARSHDNWMFGVTLHYMDHGLDTGPIIERLDVPFSVDDTAFDLYERATEKMLELFLKNIGRLVTSAERVPALPQEGPSFYFKRSDLNLEVDLRASPQEIYDAIRALTFPGKPGPFANIGNKKIYISLEDLSLKCEHARK